MILVSIIGDFHSSVIPIFYEFHKELNKHILLYDDAKRDAGNVKPLIEAQKEFVNNHGLKCQIIGRTFDEDSLESINACFADIKRHAENSVERVMINATDGLGNVKVLLANAVIQEGGKSLFYDKHDNEYNLFTGASLSKHTLLHCVPIKAHLQFQGYCIKEHSHHREMFDRKDTVLALGKDLKAYKKFSKTFRKQRTQILYPEYCSLLESIGKLSPSEEVFIKGGVIEEMIYWALYDANIFDDLLMGVTVDFGNGVFNEFDILAMKDNHLHMMECKFKSHIETAETLYKINSLIDYIDDEGKAVLISMGRKIPKLQGKNVSLFNEADYSRAKKGSILLYEDDNFNSERFIKAIKTHFDLE